MGNEKNKATETAIEYDPKEFNKLYNEIARTVEGFEKVFSCIEGDLNQMNTLLSLAKTVEDLEYIKKNAMYGIFGLISKLTNKKQDENE